MTAREAIDLYGALADMKNVDYKNTLAITTLIDLLVSKGVFTKAEFASRAQKLDASE